MHSKKKLQKNEIKKTFQYDLPLADSSQTTTKHRPMFPKYYTYSPIPANRHFPDNT